MNEHLATLGERLIDEGLSPARKAKVRAGLGANERGSVLREYPNQVLVVGVPHFEDEVDKVVRESSSEEMSGRTPSAELSASTLFALGNDFEHHSLLSRLGDTQNVSDTESL